MTEQSNPLWLAGTLHGENTDMKGSEKALLWKGYLQVGQGLYHRFSECGRCERTPLYLILTSDYETQESVF